MRSDPIVLNICGTYEREEMKPTIKERIIGLPFVTPLTSEEFRNGIEGARSILAGLKSNMGKESIIANPNVVGMPNPTFDGTLPDLRGVKVVVERAWRIELDKQYYFQIMKRSVSFHYVVKDADNIGVFDDLLHFYLQLVPQIAGLFDLSRRVARIDELFLNRMETEELKNCITSTNDGSKLNIQGVLNFPGIGVHAEGMIPCPPTYQATSYYLAGSPAINIGLDLTIPKLENGEWAIQLNLRGSTEKIRIGKENNWAAQSLETIHGHIFSLFKTIIAEHAYTSMNIKC